MTTEIYPAPEPFTVDVAGVPMSGISNDIAHPRAVVIALHGGGTTPDYFDAPGFPQQSLLRVGARLGFSVVAPDRPGYGASRKVLGDELSPADQVDLTYGVIEQVLAGRDRGAGIFLLGHSQGSVLTAKMAADPRAADLLGIEIAGTGVRHHDLARERLALPVTAGTLRSTLRNLLWEPSRLYPNRRRVLSPAPKFEGVDAKDWPEDLTALAPLIDIPVRISLGDHEYWWQSGSAGLNEIARLFTSSSRVVVDEQYESGHNLSLGTAALAYHLKVLSFVEECVLMRERIEPENHKMETTNA
ncbi:alpha/beta fold hydrolase [Rhodococcus qingshengii]|uniref:alpha/beta fold hydrolase n=1 Tax=Rhodococcus qingshengii TaxID=334542 RepID=UPI001BE6A708|nr:alpha/beta fold hydrolase [Rhodococcus qingshengii]MBT2275329.1 alpha/beta fold hydrolase [Rhodococcus qingshengii]